MSALWEVPLMIKLLNANLIRLKKDKALRIGIIFMFIMGVFTPVMHYIDMKKSGYQITLDNGFFNNVLFCVILSSVFCSLYVGTEYSDGTIRNKVVIGHTRMSIYFSNLIVCIASPDSSCVLPI